MIQNVINGKKYIGQSGNLSLRWTQHKSALKSNHHCNKLLQDEWNQYGADCFQFSIIEEATKDQLNLREQYWIDYYNSFNDGYNNELGGGGIRGFKHSQIELDKMHRIQNPYIVLQFDYNKKLIKEWIGGISHICKELGYTKDCIALRCNHTIKEMSMYKNSYWIYKEEYNHPDFTWDKYFNNEKLIDIVRINKAQQHKVCQYSLDRRLIKVWDSLAEIRKVYGGTSGISAILNHYKGKKTAYGFIWAYEGYDFSDGYFNTLEHYYNSANENRKRQIAKINPDTLDVIEIYDSLTQAKDYNDGINNVSNITVAAKGYPNHKCNNFLWKYIE